MKIKELRFVTDLDVKPVEGNPMEESLRNVLVNVVTPGLQGQNAGNQRLLWSVLDDLEAMKDGLVRISVTDWELLKQVWEDQFPKTDIWRKWLEAVDKILNSAVDVKE